MRVCLLMLGLMGAGSAAAHGFGAAYNLPVPLALYNWGAGATLVLSFLFLGLFWSQPPSAQNHAPSVEYAALSRLLNRVAPGLKILSLALLCLTIATGYWGVRDPLRNFSPIFFWVIFVLVFSYLHLLVGGLYSLLNPFQALADVLQKLWRQSATGLFQYPEKLADWPALILYLGFIWFELFSHRTPFSLAMFLSGYTALNVLGVMAIGRQKWFQHCEFFSLFFRLIGLLAPIQIVRDNERWSCKLRAPLSGLLHQRPSHISTVVFVLAMISTTAMDGLQATQWWVGLFWSDPSGIVTQFAGGDPMPMMRQLMPVYIAWESFCLFASPFVYCGLYLLAMALAKLVIGSRDSLLSLAKQFAFSLLPIALVYNITHYWTLITSHGLKILSLISDPFGWRWDLFGTAMKFRAPILPDMSLVWHSQLVLIVFGHLLSVWVAHLLALRLWRTRGRAMLSQLPLLVLMVSFTVFGLWVLAQPLTAILPR